MSKDIIVDKSVSKKLQAKLEQKISDWSLLRLQRERRLKYIIIRIMIIESLILLLQAIHIFMPTLVDFPNSNLITVAFGIWLVVLAAKYYLVYTNKTCARSASEIMRLAVEYNEASKDIPDARHFDFMPPDLIQRKKIPFVARLARAPIHSFPRL